jgi:hypothetical protein
VPTGTRRRMTVTDPDVPDPLNDPRTLQADPGAYGQGADLASTDDDPASTGEDELAADDAMTTGAMSTDGETTDGETTDGETTDGETTAGQTLADDAGGGDVTGGAFSEAPQDPGRS